MAAGLALLAAISGIWCGLTMLAARGVSIDLTTQTLSGMVAGGLLAAVVFAMLGLGVGAIARSPSAGIVFALTTLLLVDPAVAIALSEEAPGLADFTPAQSAAALAGTGTFGGTAPSGGLDPPLAGLVFLGWASLAMTCGARTFRSRDLTTS